MHCTVLQTRISQLGDHFNGEKIFTVPVHHSRKLDVKEETTKSAIKSKKVAVSAKQDAAKKKAKTTKASTNSKTKNTSATGKKSTTPTSKQ